MCCAASAARKRTRLSEQPGGVELGLEPTENWYSGVAAPTKPAGEFPTQVSADAPGYPAPYPFAAAAAGPAAGVGAAAGGASAMPEFPDPVKPGSAYPVPDYSAAAAAAGPEQGTGSDAPFKPGASGISDPRFY